MKRSFVEVQGRFDDGGKFVGCTYVPQVIDTLMQEAYQAVGAANGLSRLRITVEVEDLGAEVTFGGLTPEKSAAPSCVTAGKLIQPAIIPVPEVV